MCVTGRERERERERERVSRCHLCLFPLVVLKGKDGVTLNTGTSMVENGNIVVGTSNLF